MAQPGEEGERLPVAVRHLCREPLALAGPAAGSGHVGLDPGFASRTFGSSMKIRRLGSSRCWCAFQRTRNRATFGRIRSAAIRVFFDGLTGAPYKPPDRVMGHPHPARRQLRRERPHREVGLLRKPGQQPVSGLSRQDRATMPPDLAGPLTQAASLSLPDPHRRGHRDPEALRRRPNRLTLRKGNGNSPAQVQRKWYHHAPPPSSGGHSESQTKPPGNPHSDSVNDGQALAGC